MNSITRNLCRFLPAFFLTSLLVFPVCASAALAGPAKMANLPIPFIEQQGQHVQFVARTLGGSATVSSDGRIVYSFAGKEGKVCSINEIPVRALPAPGMEGQGLLKAKATVFHGKDPKKTLSMFESVNMGNITRGIGLTLKAYGSNVEKLYSVEPGADPTAIRMKIEGGSLSVNESGQLVVLTAQGPVSFTAPVAYQEDLSGKRELVQVAYAVHGKEYGFRIGAYDTGRALVIDPLLASTYLGGSNTSEEEIARDIALDAEGNVYVAGTTPSADFPVTDEFALAGTTDGFIAKFNADLSELLAATFIGGEGYDYVWSILVDGSSVYAAGGTTSADFPATAGAYDTVLSGDYDVFILSLDTDLATLEAATYLGGAEVYGLGGEQRPELALSSGGDLFVAMETGSLDFPMTSPEGKSPYQSTLSHSKNYYSDIAIARLSGDLTTLEASTFLGGSGSTYGYGYEHYPRIALDASGDVWVAGITGATDFPTTEGAYRESLDYADDGSDYVFVSRLDADLSTLEASTYVGCSNFGWRVALALGTGNVYVAGTSYFDKPWPVTVGAYDTDGATAAKAFISRISTDLSTLEASTLLGGTESTQTNPNGWPNTKINDMLLDSTGNVVVAGITTCSNLPTTADAYDRTADVYYVQNDYRSYPYFITKLDGDLETLSAGTYLGNMVSGDETVTALALDDSDNVYLCGITASPYFPTTQDAYDTSFNSSGLYADAFVSKLDTNLSRDTYADLALSANIESLSVTAGGQLTFTLTVENQGPDAASSVVLTSTLPGGVTFVSATPDQGTADYDSGVITCEMGTLEASGEASVVVVVQASASSGNLSASAVVSAAQIDSNAANNALSISIEVTEAVSPALDDHDDDGFCFITTAGR